MKRICVIGDSHVAALRKAHMTAGPGATPAEITFFAAATDGMRGARAKNGSLVPENEKLLWRFRSTSGGSESIDPEDFDVFVLYAMEVRYQHGLRLLETHQFFGESRGLPHVSDSAYACAIAGKLRQSTAYHVAVQLRSITAKPIYVLPQPLPAESVVVERADFEHLATIDADIVAMSSRVTDSQIRAVFEEWSVEPLTHDDSLRAETGLTPDEYTRGSLRLTTKLQETHSDDDTAHMNEEFGRVVLERLLNLVGATNK